MELRQLKIQLQQLKIQLQQLEKQLKQLKIQLQQQLYSTGASFQRAAAIQGPTGPRAQVDFTAALCPAPLIRFLIRLRQYEVHSSRLAWLD